MAQRRSGGPKGTSGGVVKKGMPVADIPKAGGRARGSGGGGAVGDNAAARGAGIDARRTPGFAAASAANATSKGGRGGGKKPQTSRVGGVRPESRGAGTMPSGLSDIVANYRPRFSFADTTLPRGSKKKPSSLPPNGSSDSDADDSGNGSTQKAPFPSVTSGKKAPAGRAGTPPFPVPGSTKKKKGPPTPFPGASPPFGKKVGKAMQDAVPAVPRRRQAGASARVTPNDSQQGPGFHLAGDGKTKLPKPLIKPSRVGLFTAKAKSAGRGVQAHAAHVMANKSQYPAATVRQANFARNFGGASRARARSGK
jgi:hypothetical protein